MKTYVVFVLGPWHKTRKTLGISQVIGVPFIAAQELLLWIAGFMVIKPLRVWP